MAISLGDINFGLGADTSSLDRAIKRLQSFGTEVDRASKRQSEGSRRIEADLRRQEAAMVSMTSKVLKMNDAFRKETFGEKYVTDANKALNSYVATLSKGQTGALNFQRANEKLVTELQRLQREFKKASSGSTQVGPKVSDIIKLETTLAGVTRKVQDMNAAFARHPKGAKFIDEATAALKRFEAQTAHTQVKPLDFSRFHNQLRNDLARVQREFRNAKLAPTIDTQGLTKFQKALVTIRESSQLTFGPLSGVGYRIGLFTSILDEGGSKGLAFAAGVAAGGYAIYQIGKKSLTAGVELQKINTIFQTVSESQIQALQSLGRVGKLAFETGGDISSLATMLANLESSTKGTAIAGAKTFQIFESIVKAGAKLQLPAQKIELALLAIEQMASKGTVTLEEMKRQLGDQLPGAMQIGARAWAKLSGQVGQSSQEMSAAFLAALKDGQVISEVFLPALQEEIDKTFNNAQNQKIDNFTAALGRAKQGSFLLWGEIDRGTGVTSTATKALDGFANGLLLLAKGMRAITGAGGETNDILIAIEQGVQGNTDGWVASSKALDEYINKQGKFEAASKKVTENFLRQVAQRRLALETELEEAQRRLDTMETVHDIDPFNLLTKALNAVFGVEWNLNVNNKPLDEARVKVEELSKAIKEQLRLTEELQKVWQKQELAIPQADTTFGGARLLQEFPNINTRDIAVNARNQPDSPLFESGEKFGAPSKNIEDVRESIEVMDRKSREILAEINNAFGPDFIDLEELDDAYKKLTEVRTAAEKLRSTTVNPKVSDLSPLIEKLHDARLEFQDLVDMMQYAMEEEGSNVPPSWIVAMDLLKLNAGNAQKEFEGLKNSFGDATVNIARDATRLHDKLSATEVTDIVGKLNAGELQGSTSRVDRLAESVGKLFENLEQLNDATLAGIGKKLQEGFTNAKLDLSEVTANITKPGDISHLEAIIEKIHDYEWALNNLKVASTTNVDKSFIDQLDQTAGSYTKLGNSQSEFVKLVSENLGAPSKNLEDMTGAVLGLTAAERELLLSLTAFTSAGIEASPIDADTLSWGLGELEKVKSALNEIHELNRTMPTDQLGGMLESLDTAGVVLDALEARLAGAVKRMAPFPPPTELIQALDILKAKSKEVSSAGEDIENTFGPALINIGRAASELDHTFDALEVGDIVHKLNTGEIETSTGLIDRLAISVGDLYEALEQYNDATLAGIGKKLSEGLVQAQTKQQQILASIKQPGDILRLEDNIALIDKYKEALDRLKVVSQLNADSVLSPAVDQLDQTAASYKEVSGAMQPLIDAHTNLNSTIQPLIGNYSSLATNTTALSDAQITANTALDMYAQKLTQINTLVEIASRGVVTLTSNIRQLGDSKSYVDALTSSFQTLATASNVSFNTAIQNQSKLNTLQQQGIDLNERARASTIQVPLGGAAGSDELGGGAGTDFLSGGAGADVLKTQVDSLTTGLKIYTDQITQSNNETIIFKNNLGTMSDVIKDTELLPSFTSLTESTNALDSSLGHLGGAEGLGALDSAFDSANTVDVFGESLNATGVAVDDTTGKVDKLHNSLNRLQETKASVEAAQQAMQQFADIGGQAIGTLADTIIDDLVHTGTINLEHLREVMLDVAADILKEMFRMAILNPLKGALFGGAVGGGAGGGIFGVLFGGAARKGMVLDSGNNRTRKMRRGGMINSRKIFNTPSGLIEAGEAGREAIMPLSRNSRGDLGVRVNDGGGDRGSNSFVMHIHTADARELVQNKAQVATSFMKLIRKGSAYA
jgi:tape measure domain-containing protein